MKHWLQKERKEANQSQASMVAHRRDSFKASNGKGFELQKKISPFFSEFFGE
jgi:hypothetical protein